MKLLLRSLIAGLVLVGATAPTAIGQEVRPTREPPLEVRATTADWRAFGEELADLRAEIALAESSIFGGGEWRERTCRFQSLERPIWTAREENLTAACVVRRLGPISGGLSKLLAVGSCESGWNRLASNGGRYLGIFQHAAAYWDGRTGLVPERWRSGNWDSVWNTRAQIVVTVRMVKAGGWGPWGCA